MDPPVQQQQELLDPPLVQQQQGPPIHLLQSQLNPPPAQQQQEPPELQQLEPPAQQQQELLPAQQQEETPAAAAAACSSAALLSGGEDSSIVGQVPNAQCTGKIDWDCIEVEERWDEEGIQEVANEQGVFRLLGLRDEDERENLERAQACNTGGCSSTVGNTYDFGDERAAILCEDSIPNEKRIAYDPDEPEVNIGSLFPSMKEFRLVMRQYAINNEFEIGIEATDKFRYRAYCRGAEDCPWNINARREFKDLPTIQVTVLNDVHTCTSSSRRRTATPTSAWVAAKALPKLAEKPHLGCTELRTLLQKEHKCEISYDIVWRGKEKALNELYGTWENSFRELFQWKAAVLEKMPDSVVEIDVKVENDKAYFNRFFCAFGPCIQGFREGCRPYLSVDATALNGRWNAQLASATAVDGHNWMYPVAFGFFDTETKENWIWWMTQLHKAIGDLPLLAICSDASKGLFKAASIIFPNAEKRECFRHLMQNYIKNHHGGSEHMYPAARAYRKLIYEHHIANIRNVPSIATYLDHHHKLLWYRSGFNPEIKCDYITNNIAEVFNNWVKDYKDLPICELAEKIRDLTMDLFHRRRRIGRKLDGKILPSVIHLLKAKTRGLGPLHALESPDPAIPDEAERRRSPSSVGRATATKAKMDSLDAQRPPSGAVGPGPTSPALKKPADQIHKDLKDCHARILRKMADLPWPVPLCASHSAWPRGILLSLNLMKMLGMCKQKQANHTETMLVCVRLAKALDPFIVAQIKPLHLYHK